MAGKKIKSIRTPKKIDFSNLQAGDVLCPICRTILIEPVTLPCSHGFCNLCFNDTMEKANLVCPLCRIRVGSWFRKAKKENKLIDELFWTAIKEKYPKEVQNKYKDKPTIIVAMPGEIRKEYELQKQKDAEEVRRLQDAEEKASAELIRKLREEEEIRRAAEEKKIKLDAELAKKLAEELSPSTSKAEILKKSKKIGPIDKFVKNEDIKLAFKNNFATKEYTSRVICLDKEKKKNINSCNSVVPVVQKKFQQIHKILETEERFSRNKSSASDMESEFKFYFKPIDIQKKYPPQGKIPVCIPTRRAMINETVQIVPPSGKITKLHCGTSAFSRFYTYRSADIVTYSKESVESEAELLPSRTKLNYAEANSHRLNLETSKTGTFNRVSKESSCNWQKRKCSNDTKIPTKRKKSLPRSIFDRQGSESPQFYGFERSSNLILNISTITETPESEEKKHKNNFLNSTSDVLLNGINEAKKRKLQEEADFQLAKKLQAEFDQIAVSSRTRRGAQRQVRIDEMLTV
ncbi:tripartite motif-containing protein 5-like isoform X2 [Cylas formicarius]|uniref:tripartite motif-containing protein 5-like isoform X2 n=1 Tax=Cylas formicarius TaxID=197179 RepID=UPI002958B5C7|nr:tripartite motif-containing protein 5-like isoform X2 [Cylas formicarius]